MPDSLVRDKQQPRKQELPGHVGQRCQGAVANCAKTLAGKAARQPQYRHAAYCSAHTKDKGGRQKCSQQQTATGHAKQAHPGCCAPAELQQDSNGDDVCESGFQSWQRCGNGTLENIYANSQGSEPCNSLVIRCGLYLHSKNGIPRIRHYSNCYQQLFRRYLEYFLKLSFPLEFLNMLLFSAHRARFTAR